MAPPSAPVPEAHQSPPRSRADTRQARERERCWGIEEDVEGGEERQEGFGGEDEEGCWGQQRLEVFA